MQAESKVTSIQAVGEEGRNIFKGKVVELVTFDSACICYMAWLSFLFHHICFPYLYGSRLQFTPYLLMGLLYDGIVDRALKDWDSVPNVYCNSPFVFNILDPARIVTQTAVQYNYT